MSGTGFPALALYDPNMFVQQQAIQRKQALANALLGSQPEQGAYGGMASAGRNILGAILANKTNQEMANLYNPRPDPSQSANVPAPVPQNVGYSGGMLTPGQEGQIPGPQGVPQPQQSMPISDKPGDYYSLPPQMQRLYDSIPHLPNLGARDTVSLFLTNPNQYTTSVLQGAQPTNEYRNALAAAGGNPAAAQQILAAQATKAGTIDLRDQGSAWIPNGRGGYNVAYGPNENLNEQLVQGPDGRMIALPIQQGAEVAAAQAGAVEQAKEQNKIIMVKLADGRKVPMWAGPATQNAAPNTSPGALPPSSAQPAMPTPAKTAATLPSGVVSVPTFHTMPTQIGQSTAQEEQQKEIGQVGGINAQVDAQTQKLLNAIQGMRALNDSVPNSTGIPAEWKGDINKRAPFLFKGDAGALSQWDQLNSIGILGGIQSLGLGRLDIPIVKQVQASGGIPADLPAVARRQMLDNLEAEVRSNQAASHQRLSNLNAPGALTPPHTPMTPYPTGGQSTGRIRKYNTATGRLE